MAALTSLDKLYGLDTYEEVEPSTLNGIQDSIIELWAGKFSGRGIIIPAWSAKGYNGAALDAGNNFWEGSSGDAIIQRIPVGVGDVIDSVVPFFYQTGGSSIDIDVNVLTAAGAESTKATLIGGGTEGAWGFNTIIVAYTMLADEAAYVRVNTQNTGDGYAGCIATYSRP